jgi:hypothetical protein
MAAYPGLITPIGHREPVPRRIRGMLGDRVVLDTTRAVYVWEWPPYPQYYVPAADLAPELLVDEEHEERLPPTWPGPTTSRPGSCCRSPGRSASTTRKSTIILDGEPLDRPRTPFSPGTE